MPASQQVDTVLVSSIRALGNPLAQSQIEGLALFAATLALADDLDAEPPSIEGCVPMLSDGADGDGDGYPGMETTLTMDCELFGFRLEGTLVLMDEDDMDPASGFNSEMDLQMTLTAEGETLASFVGDHDLQVTAMEAGIGYGLSYSGGIVQGSDYLELDTRLTYDGTLEGSFDSGRMTIAQGTISFVFTPVDCSTVAAADRETCRAEVPEHPGPPVVPLAVHSPAVITWPPGVNFVEGADRDSLVEAARGEYVVELAGSRCRTLGPGVVRRDVLRVQRKIVRYFSSLSARWILWTDHFKPDCLEPLEHSVSSLLQRLRIARVRFVNQIEIAGCQYPVCRSPI